MSSSESSRRFHFIREIASGGFGSVYLTKVIHADGFSRLVAVKLLHPRWSENEEIASRMRDEARLLGWLRHKNIVDVMDLTLIDGRCAVIMEYLDAVDIKVIINACAAQGERIPLRAALEACAAVASALDAAYNRPPYAGEKPLRVIHRDIKPSNIMMDDSGVVKVLDFGVARAEFDERESKTQEMAFGSLEYMPPERLFFEPESPASDVYSLGATLFEMLTLDKFGKAKLRPKEHEAYFEDRFDALLDNYPMHQETEDLLHELLMGMLAFDEPDRPSASDLVAQLRTFARRLKESPLEAWAEKVVPPLLRDRADEPESKTPGSLVGTVLGEDSKALDQSADWDENTGVSTRAIDIGPADDELTGRLADDARWKALKQATIEDITKRKNLAPAAVESPRRNAAPPLHATPTPPPTARRSLPPTTEAAEAPAPKAAPPTGVDWDQDLPGDKTIRLERSDLPPRIPRTIDVPPPDPIKAVPRRRHSLVGTMLLALLFGAGLAMVIFAGVLLLTFTVVQLRAPAPPPTDPAPPAPPTMAHRNKTVPTVAHAHFSSGRADTAEFRVSCKGRSYSGATEVFVEGSSLGRCTVVAKLVGGRRLRARIEDVVAGEYLCFTGDAENCTGP